MPGLDRSLESLEDENRGIVDQHVDAAELALRALHRRADVVFLRDIGRNENRAPVFLANSKGDGLSRGIDVEHDYRSALFGEELCRRLSDPVRPAGDDGDFAREPSSPHSIPVRLTISRARASASFTGCSEARRLRSSNIG